LNKTKLMLAVGITLSLSAFAQTNSQPVDGVEHPAGLGGVEEERDAIRGGPAATSVQRGGVQQPLAHRPVQQAGDNAEEMIEAAWPRPRSRGEEVVEDGRVSRSSWLI